MVHHCRPAFVFIQCRRRIDDRRPGHHWLGCDAQPRIDESSRKRLSNAESNFFSLIQSMPLTSSSRLIF